MMDHGVFGTEDDPIVIAEWVGRKELSSNEGRSLHSPMYSVQSLSGILGLSSD